MQIVIDIPKNMWEWLHIGFLDEDDGKHAINAILKGTPLPKGHGRLIDADILKKDDEVTEWLSLNAVRTGKMLKSFSELFIKKIDATPTIIEADKAESVQI